MEQDNQPSIDQKFFEESIGVFEQSFEQFENEENTKFVPLELKVEIEWIASSLGVSRKSLNKVKVDEADPIVSPGNYFTWSHSGLEIAIRADRLQAYLTKVPEGMDINKIHHILRSIFRLKCCDIDTFKTRVEHCKKDQWVLVSENDLSEFNSDNHSQLIFLDTLSLGNSFATYSKMIELTNMNIDRYDSLTLFPVFKGDHLIENESTYLSYLHEDVFGQKLDIKDRNVSEFEIQLSEGLKRQSDGVIVADKYGYLVLRNNNLEIKPAFMLKDNNAECLWLVMAKHREVFDKKMLIQAIEDFGVKVGLLSDKISELLSNGAFDSNHKVLTVAKAIETKDGDDAKIEIMSGETNELKENKKSQVDHREASRIKIFKKNELVAIKHHATVGKAGCDVIGNAVAQKKGLDKNIRLGENIQCREGANGDLEYFATCDGLLKFEEKQLSLVQFLSIDGNVDYNSGNISFPGTVIVNGSVTTGFSVKAGSDLTVLGTVENASEITCFGDLKVKRGIVGNKTRVSVKGELHVKFIQEATVTVGGNVFISDHLYHANLRCESQIKIDRAPSSVRGGSAIGGYTWGVSGVNLHFLGAASNPQTIVGVGPDAVINKEIKKLKEFSNQQHKQILYIMNLCNLKSIDQESIRVAIELANQSNNSVKLRYLNRMIELIKAYRHTLNRSKERENSLKNSMRNVNLIVRNRVYPKVQIAYKTDKITTNKELLSPKFKFQDNTLVMN